MDTWRRPEEEGGAIPAPDRPVIIEISKNPLNRRAAQVGAIAGQAVALLRDIRSRLQEPGQPRNDRLSELGAKARAKTLTRINGLRRQAASRAETWRHAAREKTAQLRRQAQTRYERTRARATQIAHDDPLRVVVAAGVTGFLLGIALRTWRANRAG